MRANPERQELVHLVSLWDIIIGQIYSLGHLKNCLSRSGKGAKILFLESICDFASLRELHFWDYSEGSVYSFAPHSSSSALMDEFTFLLHRRGIQLEKIQLQRDTCSMGFFKGGFSECF
jgi:hypothetical protein